MKTPLYELIEMLEQDYCDAYYEITKSAIRECVNYAEELLEKEKRTIIDLCNEAYENGLAHKEYSGEEIYKITFTK